MKLFFENENEKNPSDQMSIATFQLAIEKCNWEVCQLFYDNLGANSNNDLEEEQSDDPSLFILKKKFNKEIFENFHVSNAQKFSFFGFNSE